MKHIKIDMSSVAARFIEGQDVKHHDTIIMLRRLILSAVPAATEKRAWNALCYYNSSRGGPVKGSICQIEVKRDGVILAFIHGAFLKDPNGLLEGEAIAKRHVVVKDVSSGYFKQLRRLVLSAANP